MSKIGLKLAQKKYPKFKTIIQEETAAGELVIMATEEVASASFEEAVVV